MAKAPKKRNSSSASPEKKQSSDGARGTAAVKAAPKRQNPDYLWSMSHAPRVGEDTFWLQLLPPAFFTALVILIVRMHTYSRPMDQFFWTTDTSQSGITDFFSYFKMVAILICAAAALVLLLYRLCVQSLTVKRCFAYIPMAVYSVFVLLSYAFSDYKEFSLLGWNDRFEGTLVLLAYMVMLYYIINAVNTEQNVKFIIYPLVFSSVLLSLLGILQSIDKDPFRTTIGQKLIVPNEMTSSGDTVWQMIDQAASVGERFLNFTFQNKEIYQTVYNINYVSFYLTLLIPLFGMLFILSVNKGKNEPIWKKIGWGALFTMLIYNLIGSASSGGYLGLGVVGLMGIIILNKRILQWWKPVLLLLVLTIAVGGITYDRWYPEISGAMNGVFGHKEETAQMPGAPDTVAPSPANGEAPMKALTDPGSVKPTIDYIQTGKRDITMSINGNPLTIQVTATDGGAVEGLILLDKDNKAIPMYPSSADKDIYTIGDDRFHDYMTLSYSYDGNEYYVLVNTPDMQWPFAISEDQIYYRNQLGKKVNLYDVPRIGWKDNPRFGSWRGFIWSRTLPLIKDTLLIGHGADTYCIYFPQNDYAGKYSTGFENNFNIIVDKPHNMYLSMAVGTGVVSVLAFLALWVLYAVQSAKIYFKRRYEHDYLTYAGAGIFFGIIGFLISALVDDSSVSVMPLFYGLLGMGIAINAMLAKQSVRTDAE